MSVLLTLLLELANVLAYVRHPGLIRQYRRRLQRWPNVCRPRSRTEKLLWRRIFDGNPFYRLISDKLMVRDIVKLRCPGLAMPEVVWVGTAAAQIPDELLSPGFVIKANNGSGRNIFMTAGPAPRAMIESKMEKWLRTPYGVHRGEWCYEQIVPRVFVEELVACTVGTEFVELCCHVQMGTCVMATAFTNIKKPGVRWAFFDREGNRLSVQEDNSRGKRPIVGLPADFRLPSTYAAAVKHAEVLGRDCDYIRVDFLCPGETLYFCECTVMPGSGLDSFPAAIESRLAEAWDLRNSWFMQNCNSGLLGGYAGLLRARLKRGMPGGQSDTFALPDGCPAARTSPPSGPPA